MSVEEQQQSSEQEAPQTSPRNGEIVVPRWVILVTFIIGWAGGGAMMVNEILGQGRFSVLILAAWLITLPLVASNPFSALREMAAGVFQGRGGGK